MFTTLLIWFTLVTSSTSPTPLGIYADTQAACEARALEARRLFRGQVSSAPCQAALLTFGEAE